MSFAVAGDCALQASAQVQAGGMNTTYIGYDKDMTRQFIDDAASWAKIYELAASPVQESIFEDPDKDILTFRLEFASGFEIVALSSKPRNLRSRKGRVVLDEFAWHPDPPGLFEASIALTMWGGIIDIISSANGKCPYFDELCFELAPERGYYFQQTTLDDAIQDGLYELIAEVNRWPNTRIAASKWRGDLIRQYGKAAKQELFCISDTASESLFEATSPPGNPPPENPWCHLEACFASTFAPPFKKHRYLLAIDPNFGAIGGDNYVAQVWDCTRLPIELVAEYADNGHSNEYHRLQTLKLIDCYVPEIVVFETNSGGRPLAERLQTLLPRQRIELALTTQNSKIINTDRIALLVEEHNVKFPPTWPGVEEMKNFSKLDRKAIKGKDDRVMAFAHGMVFFEELVAIGRRHPALTPNQLIGSPLAMMPMYKNANLRAPLTLRPSRKIQKNRGFITINNK